MKDAQILYQNKDTTTVSLEDFNIIQMLCTGSSGKVFLVENKTTSKRYVMKMMTKDSLKGCILIEDNKIEEEVNKRVYA
jgi:serine/threonine protein kinase